MTNKELKKRLITLAERNSDRLRAANVSPENMISIPAGKKEEESFLMTIINKNIIK